MNKIFSFMLVLVASLLCNFTAVAQDDKSSMNLHFVYIAHEVTTPVNDLCSKLRTLQEDASDVDDALIVYLSDGRASLYSFTNLKDFYGKQRDTDQAFIEVIAALQDANSHDVIAQEDISNILKLFDEYNFVDENGKITYSSVTFDFYVGASFWSLGNNEKVIAHLYQDFNMKSLPKGTFQLNIYKPKAEKLTYSDGQPFGDNNVEGINEKVKIFEY